MSESESVRESKPLGGSDSGPDDRKAPWRSALVFTLAIPLGWGALRLAAMRPEWVDDIYSQGIYPGIRALLRGVSGILPLHLAETLLLVLVIALLARFYRAWLAWSRCRRSLGNLAQHGVARLLRFCSIGYLFFLLAWGFNHARLPYSRHVGLQIQEVGQAELEAVLTILVAECNALRLQFDDSAFEIQEGPGGVDPRIVAAYSSLEEEVPILASSTPILRQAWLSPILSRLGISGIYSPFTGEAHINSEISPYMLAFSSAHELAHYKGFAREDEANYIAWQVCRASTDPAVRYSGTLIAMNSATSALNRTDWLSAMMIRDGLREEVLADLDQNRKFWDSVRTVVTDVAEVTNDVYLKSQGQREGRKSYGRMVDLIVAEWRRDSQVSAQNR